MSKGDTSAAKGYVRSIAAQYCTFLRTVGLNPAFYDLEVDTLRYRFITGDMLALMYGMINRR
jgi:hypothetical protein